MCPLQQGAAQHELALASRPGQLDWSRHCPPCHLTTSQWSGQSRLGTPVGAIGHPRCGEVIREAWGQLREHSQYPQEMG